MGRCSRVASVGRCSTVASVGRCSRVVSVGGGVPLSCFHTKCIVGPVGRRDRTAGMGQATLSPQPGRLSATNAQTPLMQSQRCTATHCVHATANHNSIYSVSKHTTDTEHPPQRCVSSGGSGSSRSTGAAPHLRCLLTHSPTQRRAHYLRLRHQAIQWLHAAPHFRTAAAPGAPDASSGSCGTIDDG